MKFRFQKTKRLISGISMIVAISLPNIASAHSKDWFQEDHYVCFSRNESCESKIIDLIDEAEESIDVFAYLITSDNIADALIAAKKKGVEVKVTAQDVKKKDFKRSKLENLEGQGISVQKIKGDGIFHHKIMIFDNKRMFTGSFNFTWSAENRNHQNVLFLKDKKIIKDYKENVLVFENYIYKNEQNI